MIKMSKKESKDNVLSSEVVPETKQVEYRSSRFSVGFHVLLPVAGLILITLGRKQIFEKILNQIDKRCLTVICPRFIKKEALLKWASGRLPPTWSSHYTKTLSGGIEDLWKDGSLLCTLINVSVPGACPNPHRHWKKPPVHAQAMAYKYFGVIPIFTNEELQKSLNSQLERKFIKYLSEIQLATNKITENSEKEKKITERYIVRGMGVFSGEQHKTAEFYIYLDENCDDDNEGNIIIQIRGPFGSFGEAISPRLINKKRKFRRKIKSQRRSSSIKLIENLQSFQWNFARSQKKAVGEEIDVEATLENDRIKVCYIPQNYGMYEITMIAGGEVIKGCPFNVHIFINEKCESGITLKTLRHSRTIRKIIDSSERKMHSTENQAMKENVIPEEKPVTHKSSFNFKEVIDEITKHGTVFKTLLDDKSNYEHRSDIITKDTISFNDTDQRDPLCASNILESNSKENYKCETETPITNINENISDVIANEPVMLPADMEPNLKNSTKKNADPVEITSTKLAEENNNIVECLNNFIINELYLKEDGQSYFNNWQEKNADDNKVHGNKIHVESVLKVTNTYTNITTRNLNVNDSNQNGIKDLIETKYVNTEMVVENDEKINDKLGQDENNTIGITNDNISPVVTHIYKDINKKIVDDIKDSCTNTNGNLSKADRISNETEENVETKSNYKSNIVFASTQFKAQNRVLQLKNTFENKNGFKEKGDKIRDTELSSPVSKWINNSHSNLDVSNDTFKSEFRDIKLKNNITNNFNKELIFEEKENDRVKENELAIKIQKFFNQSSSNKETFPDLQLPETNESNNLTRLANNANHYMLNKQLPKFKSNNSESKPIFANKQQVPAIDKNQLDHNKCTSYVCQPRYMENVNVNKVKIPERFIGPPTKNCIYRLDDKYFKNILNESNKVTQKICTREELLDKKEIFDNSIKNKTADDCVETCNKSEINNSSVKDRIQMYLEPNSTPKYFKIIAKDTSPICPDHIESEVVGVPKTVAERRKVFAQSSLGSESNSKNSSFSDNESSLGSSVKKFKIADITTLNSLNDSINSPNEGWSLCSTVSMPNLSMESDWSPIGSVKEKKFFWENVSSRSSSSISNKSVSPKKVKRTLSELERSKLIWKKPDDSTVTQNGFKEKINPRENLLGKSADDILCMTESLTYQHNKKYQSIDESLNKCTVLSIEERKKMLLKQAYEQEKNSREKIKQMKKMISTQNLKDVAHDKITITKKETVRFSPISEKIKRYNSVVQLPTQENKLSKPIQIRKVKSFHIRTTTKEKQELDTSSNHHFKQTIKYFKNLEKQSQTVNEQQAIPNNDLENIKATTRYRTGSLNLPKISDKFSVHNLYDDVFGHNHGSFKGTPNRSALVEALATFTRNSSKYDVGEDTEDDIQYELFKHGKRRRRKSLKSIFDIYY